LSAYACDVAITVASEKRRIDFFMIN
jgi:hypothetical protein